MACDKVSAQADCERAFSLRDYDLAGRHDEALSLLSEAVEHGFSTQDTVEIENDADLKSLHGNARFERIVADAKRRAETSR